MQAHLRLEEPSQSRAFREGFLLYTRNSSTKTTHDVAALTTGRARSAAGFLISVIPWWLDARSKLSRPKRTRYTLLGHSIIPYLRGFQSGGWHADVQARPKENPGAHANGCRDVCAQRIVVRVILLDHADKPLAGESVNPLALRIEIHVVARSTHRHSRNLFASIGIKYDQQGRSPGNDEKSVIVFIESHRIVCPGSVQLPLRQPAGFPVDHIDYTAVVRHVDENARSLLF